MTVSVLLPVSRFGVHYQIGSGKPFSELHRLVLKAVGEGSDTLESLENFFFVPQRLLLEILTNLFQEGWLSMTHGGRIRLTALGRDGCEGKRAPVTHRVSERTDFLLLERYSGGVANQRETYWQHRAALRRRGVWEASIKMRADYLEDRLSEGQVRPLLRHQPEEWIRFIDQPYLDSKDWHWVELQVELEAQQVIGLPPRWQMRLRDNILEHVLELPSQVLKDAAAAGALPSRRGTDEDPESEEYCEGSPILIDPARQVLLGVSSHRERLIEAFRQSNSSILVCTPSLQKIEPEIAAAISAAAARGVAVDVVWSAGESSALDSLRGLAGAVGRESGGQIRFNEDPLATNVSVVIWDEDQTWRALLGGFPWLGSPSFDSFCFSVEIDHPGLVAEVCLTLSGIIYDAKRHRLSGAANRWRQVSADLERTSLERHVENPNCSLLLVHNQDHGARMLEVQRTSQASLLVAGSYLSKGARDRFRGLALRRARPEFRVKVIAGGVHGGAIEELTAASVEGAIIPSITSKMAAECVIADTTALFGPHRWLSESVKSSSDGFVYELGFQVDQGPLPDYLLGHINGLLQQE